MHPVLVCQDCKKVIRPGEKHIFMDAGHFIHEECPKPDKAKQDNTTAEK